MIYLPIKPEDVELAKNTTKLFDGIKVYNKIECDDNYIGFLGELLFHRYLEKQGIEHIWPAFVKKGWDEPDFIIKDKGYDLKTTFTTGLWVQQPKFDYYIFARINKDYQDNLILIGYVSNKRVKALINSNKAEVITRGSRIDYIIPVDKLRPIEELFGKLK